MAAKKLNTKKIINIALNLIEQKGLEKFSMRALALKLKIEPMSLYHYFPSRLDLLNSILDQVLGDVQFLDTSHDWRTRLRHAAFEWRNIAMKYPNFYHFVGLHRMNTRAALYFLETNMQIVLDAGLKPERAADFFRVLGFYITGAALDETTRFSKGPSATRHLPDAELAHDFPNVVSFAARYTPDRYDMIFTLGLETLLDSISSEVSRSKR